MSSYTLSVQMRADAAQLLSSIRGASGALRSLGRDVDSLHRTLGRVGSGSAGLRGISTDADGARRSLRQVGSDGDASMRQLRRGLIGARQEAHHLRNLVAGGGFVAGLAEIAREGNEYQRAIQKWGAVTSASGQEMVMAAAKARELGADLKIPGTSASKAAAAMLELAKAGQTSTSSIANARAAMQLAAADNLSAADAARYLGDVMDQFGLSSNNAGRAADVLAAGANAASGGLQDIYYAMSYTGPVAAQLGISLEDTAASVAMLARSGILGSKAGTSLRGIFTNLAAPTKRMKEGLAELGIEAWDTQGNFKGLRTVVEGFEKAQHRLSQQDFTASLSKVVGKPALAGAMALAHQGVESFDQMRTAIGRTGAAGEIAASQTKGLAGALNQLKSQAKNSGQVLYTAAAPGLEKLTRLTTKMLSAGTPAVAGALDYLHDLYTLAKPSASAAAAKGLGELWDAVSSLGGPAKDLAFDVAAAGLNVLVNVGRAGVDIFNNLVDAARPVADALAEVTDESGAGATALDIIVTAFNLASTAASGLSGALVPIGAAVGWLVRGFSALPGPVQTAIVAMMLARRVAPMMQSLGQTVSGPVVGAYRSWGDQMRVQASLAAAQGQSVGRIGQALAVLQTRIPIVGQMSAAFRSAEGPASGLARSIGVGLGGAARGLMGALGGPWGVAIAAAGVGLSMLASHQQKAAQAAAEHQSRISSLSQALRDSNGAITESVRGAAAQAVMDAKVFDGKARLVDVMSKAGVNTRQLTDAYLGQDGGLNALQKRLKETADASREMIVTNGGAAMTYTTQGFAYAKAADAIGSVKGEMSQAVKDAKDLADATGSGAKSAADSVGPFGKFSDAMRRLSDSTADADTRARALHDALNILAGGSVNLSAAEARLNRQISDANEAFKGGVDHAQGYGKVLLNMDGSLSTVTRNGQKLFDVLQGLSTNSADAALAAYQFAEANGKTVPEALQAAQKQMQSARESAISTAEGFGLTAEQAGRLADAAGLVPEQVSILLQTAGMDASMSELIAVQQALKATPDHKTVTIATLSNEAREDLKKLGFSITDLKDRRVQVTAPTDLARTDLDALIAKISQTPGAKHVAVSSSTAETIASLENVKTAIAGVPGGKSIVMSAPTETARQELVNLGFSIDAVPGSKNVSVTVPTGSATSGAATIQGAINSIYGRTVTVTTVHNDIFRTSQERGPGPWADGYRFASGGILTYASGGVRENHVAQIARGGEWRVWAEDETQGEAYIPFASGKRARSKSILDQVARRFGGEVTYNASGGLSDWSYQALGGSGFSVSDVVSKSKKKQGDKEVFDLGLFESNLRSSVSTAQSWRSNLTTVAQRAGTDVAKALEDMGDDGVELTRKMATGSTRYVQDMADQLKKLSATARASLADYTAQLQNAVKDNTAFQSALTQLATSGFGALAERLAKQNDGSAETLAQEAVRDRGKAEKANAAAEAAGKSLDGEQLTDLVKLIGALSAGRGIHDVADQTGLGEDRLIEVANLAASQLRGTGARGERFLADLVKANRGLAYANGGIWEPGVYGGAGATKGLIKFAEPETRGESYIPHSAAKRGRATAVLGATAGKFGYGLVPRKLVDAGSGHAQVVVVQQSPAIGTQTINVSNSPASANDIAASMAYQLRRAQRGGLR
ncbi:phage tail tape measure protein [Streptomyces sp. H27-H1]|uniref:phage tail tape measure protein n=1 Tax=unclassified Streptomyces TaxID=2593676 RepID=UPI00226E06DC|nr:MULTISPECIES: phage tail tape measure protein [unclassified Streptomyces]MCY0929483.1 phage tail tape measure protein [Streptomyces sp. H27-H1]MCY0938848.1 phage tail tape measure protein [Streptomyces sp. H34-S4]